MMPSSQSSILFGSVESHKVEWPKNSHCCVFREEEVFVVVVVVEADALEEVQDKFIIGLSGLDANEKAAT